MPEIADGKIRAKTKAGTKKLGSRDTALDPSEQVATWGAQMLPLLAEEDPSGCAKTRFAYGGASS
jgi:hypothetical protein